MLVANVVFTPTFTEVGHLSAFLVGMLAERCDAAVDAMFTWDCAMSERGIRSFTRNDNGRRHAVTSPESTPDQTQTPPDDEVLAPATPGAQALPTTGTDGVDPERPAD